ncbi:hypothetical protein CWATWH0401_774 [Crocosphaera watsonii WH 0401]|uniref:Uncharacterized protein n=1 Tax=Crocosphaera watsonii WH 0401 TaxID=555881 RepID=T2JG48_CROWT|nr:hypothetical protein CWATWH0401_774 [Crocosphaera watsonii WH 0401]
MGRHRRWGDGGAFLSRGDTGDAEFGECGECGETKKLMTDD